MELKGDAGFESTLRDEFSSRLDEAIQARRAAQDAASTPPPPVARPATPPRSGGGLFSGLFGKRLTEKAMVVEEITPTVQVTERTLGKLASGLEDLSTLLGDLGSATRDASQRDGEFQEGVRGLSDAVQALPAIGRGQLSILSGLSAEHRSLGNQVTEKLDLQVERALDTVHAVEGVQERTTEVVRSIDELSGIMRVTPEELQQQTRLLGEIRGELEETREALGQLLSTQEELSFRLRAAAEEQKGLSEAFGRKFETTLTTSLARHEDVLVEGFVTQTAAVESLRESQEKVPEALQGAMQRSSNRLSVLAMAASLLIVVGVGGTMWFGQGRQATGENLDGVVEELRQDREALASQFTGVRTTFEDSLARAEKERADLLTRLRNLIDTNEKLMAVQKGVRNENSILKARVERLSLENRTLRTMDEAGSRAEVRPAGSVSAVPTDEISARPSAPPPQ